MHEADTSPDDGRRAQLYLAARRLIGADAADLLRIQGDDIDAVRPSVAGFRSNGMTTFDGVMDLDVR